MKLVLRYFDGCPHWQVARDRLEAALRDLGRGDQPIELEVVESEADAGGLAFRGSPTILIDGLDPFAVADAPVGFSCRLHATENGYQGAPSVAQLREALSTSG